MTIPPTQEERWIVWRCLLEGGLLIGSIDEVWTHQHAWNTFKTLHECMDALELIINANLSVNAITIRACVLQSDNVSSMPFAMREMSEFLVENDRARNYWQTHIATNMHPHRCPHCGAAAFIGFNLIDCLARCR